LLKRDGRSEVVDEDKKYDELKKSFMKLNYFREKQLLLFLEQMKINFQLV
jgi:hypothetical protein